ncbi:hypothetical protein K505DRAFT_370941 [Melanomma pulvis-pyrius CBS 109.77]|uniref:RanBP2-type domain-containing protein n=1 Tax=Melanomma pulvis-pyrius CBS 109.77 TaxID=1314802 RepID=A0A6A6XUT5_9PLEO|nr:hypothetical protein K505DRAFT_370941 [Melanomma pulvis-pyrius CBS 109.77]
MALQSLTHSKYLAKMENYGKAISRARMPAIRENYNNYRAIVRKNPDRKAEITFLHTLLQLSTTDTKELWDGFDSRPPTEPKSKQLIYVHQMWLKVAAHRRDNVQHKWRQLKKAQRKEPTLKNDHSWMFRLVLLSESRAEDLLEQMGSSIETPDPEGDEFVEMEVWDEAEDPFMPPSPPSVRPRKKAKYSEDLPGARQKRHSKPPVPGQEDRAATSKRSSSKDFTRSLLASLDDEIEKSTLPEGSDLTNVDEAEDESNKPSKGTKRKRRERGEYRPRVGDWKCKMCGWWNSRFDRNCWGTNKETKDLCSGKRILYNMESVQADDGVAEHRQGGDHVGAWYCGRCAQWNNAWNKFCYLCAEETSKDPDFVMKDDEGLPPPPRIEWDDDREKKKRFYKLNGRSITPRKKPWGAL